MEARLDEALAKASDAFWASISESYPEVTTGDFGPEETRDYELATKRAVATWLMWNAYEEEDQEAAREILNSLS